MAAARYMVPIATTVEEHQREARVALLPVGSFEQHGPYLPLATDTVIAHTVAQELAATYPALTLPPVTISCSQEHAAWPGTVSISATTLHAMISDISHSLRASGIHRLAVINGHGGNHVLANLVQEADGRMALFPGLPEWADARSAAGIETSNDADMHAGELETSILLHAHPELVRSGYTAADCAYNDRRHLPTLGLAAYTSSGVLGYPSLASAQKGRDVLSELVRAFAGHLRALGC